MTFMDWFKYFVYATNQLHQTQSSSFWMDDFSYDIILHQIAKARKCDITVICMPLQSMHKLQSLDRN